VIVLEERCGADHHRGDDGHVGNDGDAHLSQMGLEPYKNGPAHRNRADADDPGRHPRRRLQEEGNGIEEMAGQKRDEPRQKKRPRKEEDQADIARQAADQAGQDQAEVSRIAPRAGQRHRDEQKR